MADMVRIFNKYDGTWIGQIRTSADRSYALISETNAQFPVSVYDTKKCNTYLLDFGGVVLIENSDGLLAWPGVIDSIDFDNGAAIINAFTPERYFSYRRGPTSWTLTGTAGEIFAQMIRYINSVEQTVLAVGNIDSKTGTMQETLNPTLLIDNLKRIVDRSGEGYTWRPEVVNGKLTIYADWHSNLVLDAGLILHDGRNISGDHPLHLSPPLNDILGYGDGTDWTKRITVTKSDSESIERYGRRQASMNVPTPSVDTLDQAVRVTLTNTKQPQYSFPLSALNFNETYKKLFPGSLATLTKLVGQGFSQDGLGYISDSILVKGMSYSPATGYVSLTL